MNKQATVSIIVVIFVGMMQPNRSQLLSGSSFVTTTLPITNPGKLGETCEIQNVPCKDKYSECIENVCRCKVEKPGTNEACLECVDSFQSQCFTDKQCQCQLGPYAICQNYLCRCQNDRGWLTLCTERGESKVLIGQPCSSSKQCVPSSECNLSGICSCGWGYIQSSDLDFCLPFINRIGEKCWEDQQCQQGSPGRLSGCFGDEFGERFCNCTANAVYSDRDSKCVLVADGEYNIGCSVQDQCTVKMGRSQCLDGECVCLKGSKRSWNGICE